MSAVVCGSKRSYFEDQHPSTASPIPITKKLRRCSPPPGSAAPGSFPAPSLLDRLSALFPHMEAQVLERALEACGNDIDAAIKSLHELCLGSAEENHAPAEESVSNVEQVPVADNGSGLAPEDPLAPNNIPADGPEWVELFVKEMMSATSLDDARARAARALEVFEHSVSRRAGAQAVENSQQETIMLKQQIEALMRENSILKRAVAIQHERQKECEDKNRELQQLRQLVSQYQEQLRMLEVNNYALTMHLKQAQQSNSIPGRFNPDVF
ncbi:uncharacterized protein LOC116199156 [Punica granatum]|uniref:CUE domain-containing protein n=2 Tax=Punica granatum TaxID=22663 RepID=A0A218X9D7_PUNGR|nr:uncharacterized protein LOC116199156 [Punica granatum]OWM81845.1 hypothetical protein CDL15_Pgr007883 [Punica granatum]PKI48485.1 hypothetical protein CRG98_031107 [Punica granatum]